MTNMYIRKYKNCKIIRYSWWRFWTIDDLEFNLPQSYMDAFEDVRDVGCDDYKSWVLEDIREKLELLLINTELNCVVMYYEKLVSRTKKLSVRIHTLEYGQSYFDFLNFYIIDGAIYFDSDVSVRREKLLNKLGI